MKRAIIFLLVTMLSFFSFTPAFAEEEELENAAKLGFSLERASTVSYRALYSLFDHLIELVRPERLAEWKSANSTARAAQEPVTRANAMVAIFNLADFLGNDYFCVNSWETIVWDNDWNQWHTDAYWGDPERFPYGFNGNNEDDGSSAYDANSYFYATGRVSLKTGKPLFDYDNASDSMRVNDLLTDSEAIKAVLRLLESGPEMIGTEGSSNECLESTDHNAFVSRLSAAERKPTEMDARIRLEAEKRKSDIRNAVSDITVSGQSYYVSSSGRDSNSGLSPQDAWKSLEKVNAQRLNPGDAVFFKRGDTWRGECLLLREGVTYSAYGQGCKPAIYGSPENGAGSEKWALLDGTSNIWVFYKDLLECGTIVLNDEIGAFKIHSYTRGGRFTNAFGNDFDVKTALTDNLSFYSYDDIFLESDNAWARDKTPGKLYLRCDEGNPGAIYDSIEFNTWPNTSNGYKGLLYSQEDARALITVDNLTIKYTGGYGIYLGGASACIQNSEIGWIGGCETNQNDEIAVCSGNCVGNFGEIDRYKVLNCYLYQAYDSGISNEASCIHKNIEYSGNLIEKCLFGIEMLSGTEGYSRLENVSIQNNIILESGYGFGSIRQQRLWNIYDAAIMIHPYYSDAVNVMIRDNIFYLSKGYLVICGSKEKPAFQHNTYVQNDRGGLCLWRSNNSLAEYAFDESAEETLKSLLHDEDCILPSPQ